MSPGGSDGTPRLDRASKRLLVADDSDTYRAVATRVLADAGYVVDGAGDGAEALRLLQEAAIPHDLALLELNLPKLRGLDLIRRLRENPSYQHLRLVVVSESLSEHLRRVLSELRLDASLTKNHALRELLYQVDALLFPAAADERRAPRRLQQLPVNYWLGEKLCLQSCFDLSQEGMFIVTGDEAPPAVGTPLVLRFWLPSTDRLVACEGEVMWLNTAAGDLRISHPPGMGLRFTRIAPADVALIRQFLSGP